MAGEEDGGAPAPEVLRAGEPEEISALLEVLLDQEFVVEEVRHLPRERAVLFPFTRKFPPRKGRWVLRVSGASSLETDRRGVHVKDSFKTVLFDRKAGAVIVRCVLDEFRVPVDRLDLRLEARDAPPAAGPDHVPGWLRKEAAEKAEREESERLQSAERLRLLHRRYALWTSGGVLVLGLLGGGSLPTVLASSLLLAGPGTYGILRFLRGDMRARVLLGCLLGLCGVLGGARNPVVGFCEVLVLVCAGFVLATSARSEEDLVL